MTEEKQSPSRETPPDLAPSAETLEFLARIFKNYEADPDISAALQRDDALLGAKQYQVNQNM